MKLMMNSEEVVSGDIVELKEWLIKRRGCNKFCVGEDEWEDGEEVDVDKMFEMMEGNFGIVYCFDEELVEMGDDYVEFDLVK